MHLLSLSGNDSGVEVEMFVASCFYFVLLLFIFLSFLCVCVCWCKKASVEKVRSSIFRLMTCTKTNPTTKLAKKKKDLCHFIVCGQQQQQEHALPLPIKNEFQGQEMMMTNTCILTSTFLFYVTLLWRCGPHQSFALSDLLATSSKESEDHVAFRNHYMEDTIHLDTVVNINSDRKTSCHPIEEHFSSFCSQCELLSFNSDCSEKCNCNQEQSPRNLKAIEAGTIQCKPMPNKKNKEYKQMCNKECNQNDTIKFTNKCQNKCICEISCGPYKTKYKWFCRNKCQYNRSYGPKTKCKKRCQCKK